MNSDDVEPEPPENNVQAEAKGLDSIQGDHSSAESNQSPTTGLEAESLEYQHDLRKLAWVIVIAMYVIGILIIGYAQYYMFRNLWMNGVIEIQKESTVKQLNARNRDYYIKNDRKRPADEASEDFWETYGKVKNMEKKQESNRDMRSELLVKRTIGMGVLALGIILTVFMLIGKLRREQQE